MTDNEQAVMKWMASGDTGISSESIAYSALGVERRDVWGWGFPLDPSDLGRCLRLICLCPWVKEPAFKFLANKRGWRKLIPRWDEIAQSMSDEVGIAWTKGESAPQTYKLMNDILGTD